MKSQSCEISHRAKVAQDVDVPGGKMKTFYCEAKYNLNLLGQFACFAL